MHASRPKRWLARLRRDGEVQPLLSWLNDSGSLTERLQAKGEFSLHVLHQHLQPLSHDEAKTLGLRQHRLAWIREVSLHCNGRPVVFAHSVLPCAPRGPLIGWLERLGERSLGTLLFSHAGFSRSFLEKQRIDRRHALYRPAIAALQMTSQSPATLWARRSRFSFGGQTVLVTEIFAPPPI